MNEEKKENDIDWKVGLTMLVVIMLAFWSIFFGSFFVSTAYACQTCATLQAANTAPGFQYGYNFWTGCRVHIPSGLWVPQADLDKYITPDPAVHLPKEFLK
jgi:hypothetical protein